MNEVLRLRAELADARLKIDLLTLTVRDQAKALAELTDECPPWAPSVACVYWLYSETRRSDACWYNIWKALRPLVDDVGDLPAAKLRPLVWERHRARRRASGRACDSTLNVALGRVKEMLDWAVAGNVLRFNPLAAARGVKAKNRRDTALLLGDVDSLVAACKLVKDGRRTRDDGLRRRVLEAFVLALHDSMLRFDEARMLLRQRIGADGRVELVGKGGKRRVVFLTARTLRAIAALPVDPSGYVFAEDGRVLHERRLHYWWTKLRKVSGIDRSAVPGEHVVPHVLRASGATNADEAGARATAIRDALGHSRLATTEIYLRSAQAENARSVAVVMARAIRRGPKKATGGYAKVLSKSS
jgi:integrase